MSRAPRDPGSGSLDRIAGFQAGLVFLGFLAWLFRSLRAALAFLLGGLAAMLFWHLHRWIVVRLLTPSASLRWMVGLLAMGKLALLALVLRGIMDCFPRDPIPSAAGLLIFGAAILLEAVYLAFRPETDDN